MKKKVYKEKYKRGFLGEEVPDYMEGRSTYMCDDVRENLNRFLGEEVQYYMEGRGTYMAVDVLDSIFQILKQSIQCFLQRMTRDIAVSKF